MSSVLVTRRAVYYAAQECRFQMSGELSVAWMIDGWRRAALRANKPITLAEIVHIGRLVEPMVNANGIREVDVRVGHHVLMSWAHVPAALKALITAQPTIGDEAGAAAWFENYEHIHPFRDGNGRTGSIFYNWLRGSLREPIHPPNVFGDGRRAAMDGYPHPLRLWER